MVSFNNITLRNVEVYNALLPPGIIRCNETNPCTGFVFDNVNAHGWWKYLRISYIVENVYGTVSNSSPVPAYITPDGDGYVGDDDLVQIVQMVYDYVKMLFKKIRDAQVNGDDAEQWDASSELEWSVAKFS